MGTRVAPLHAVNRWMLNKELLPFCDAEPHCTHFLADCGNEKISKPHFIHSTILIQTINNMRV